MSNNTTGNSYEPELGQALFGQPYKEFNVPEWLESFLQALREEIRQPTFDPFGNYGDAYKTDKFEVEAYSWDEDYEQAYNFKWRDLEISWYKYLGRGMSMNREMAIEEGQEMLADCLDSIRTKEKTKE